MAAVEGAASLTFHFPDCLVVFPDFPAALKAAAVTDTTTTIITTILTTTTADWGRCRSIL